MIINIIEKIIGIIVSILSIVLLAYNIPEAMEKRRISSIIRKKIELNEKGNKELYYLNAWDRNKSYIKSNSKFENNEELINALLMELYPQMIQKHTKRILCYIYEFRNSKYEQILIYSIMIGIFIIGLINPTIIKSVFVIFALSLLTLATGLLIIIKIKRAMVKENLVQKEIEELKSEILILEEASK